MISVTNNGPHRSGIVDVEWNGSYIGSRVGIEPGQTEVVLSNNTRNAPNELGDWLQVAEIVNTTLSFDPDSTPGNGVESEDDQQTLRIPVILTPQQQVERLLALISYYVSEGLLNKGNGNALSRKLDLKFDGSPSDGNKLNAFSNQVDAFMRSGTLTPDAGQALLDGLPPL